MRNREGPALVSGSGFLLVLIPARYEYVGGATVCEQCSVTQNKKALVSNSLNLKYLFLSVFF